MAIQLQVNQQLDINTTVGTDTDYTYTLSSPSRGTITSEGVFTAVSSGLTTIVVTRNSDSQVVARFLVEIESAVALEPSLFTVVVAPIEAGNAFFTISQIDSTTLQVDWEGITAHTADSGDPENPHVATTLHIRLFEEIGDSVAYAATFVDNLTESGTGTITIQRPADVGTWFIAFSSLINVVEVIYQFNDYGTREPFTIS
jgi:hypothetical protein